MECDVEPSMNSDSVDLPKNFTKRIIILVPLISYPKDAALINSEVYIAMALLGGTGIIPANFSTIIDQAKEIAKVKCFKHGYIPQCIRKDNNVLDLFKDQTKDFAFAVVTDNGQVGGKLLGEFQIVCIHSSFSF